jgi:hypothetical protein
MVERISVDKSGWLAPCFRSEQYVITVEVGSFRYKLLQFMFRKTDGSLFINFPYYAYKEGIVSHVTWLPELAPPANLDLKDEGKVTSHSVKYSHHPDGRAHFSQDGKVFTVIKKQSVPINDIQGHVFTVQLQGLNFFEQLRPIEYYLPPSVKRTVLIFPFGDKEPEAIKIVGRWYSQAVLMSNMKSGILSPRMTAITPQGKEYSSYLCSSPEGHAGEGRIMVITCEGIPKLSKDEETTLTFIGGFDMSTIVNDLSTITTFLALSYPVDNANALRKRIDTIDLIDRAPSKIR